MRTCPTGRQVRALLIDEQLPEVGKTHELSSDPEMRAVSGASSGGICAFTVAWDALRWLWRSASGGSGAE